MQLLIRKDAINWAKSLKKSRLVKSIECVGIIEFNGQEYVTATSLEKIMRKQTYRELTAAVTSYIFN